MTELQARLISLIGHTCVPAALVDLSTSTFVSSNRQFAQSYDLEVGDRITLEQNNCCISKECFAQICAGTPFSLSRCAENDADFSLLQFSDNDIVIIEMPHRSEARIVHRMAETESIPENDRTQAMFNFSYTYSFSTGVYSCSSLSDMVSMGILDESSNVETFNLRDIICDDDLSSYDEFITSVKNDGGNQQSTYCLKLASGDVVAVSDFASRIAPAGQWPIMVGTVVCSIDSFETIQHAERQVLVGRLVGGMIHDFKNLLTGIQNIIEWCISQSEADNPVTEALNRTICYTEQATNLISGALKVSAGEVEKSCEAIELGEVVKDFEGLIRRIMPASTKVVTNIDVNLPVLYGQRSLVQDLILNLCVNARDAMKAQGDSLTITVSLDKTDECLQVIVLSVSDSGCGMNKQQLDSIFNAFYSTKDTGAGLGLWMVREAVKSFGGAIDVLSTPGEGTTFIISFPVTEAPDEYEPLPEFITDSSNDEKIDPVDALKIMTGRKVLFIEDEPLIRSGVSAWLESWGVDLLTADNGVDGLRLFVENCDELELVIQDYILPGKRGDELLKEFTVLNPDVPVIMSSANPDKGFVESMMDLGAFAFLEKPFRMDMMQSLLLEAFGD